MLVEDRFQQFLFGTEIIRDHRKINTGLIGNITYRGFSETLISKEPQCYLHEVQLLIVILTFHIIKRLFEKQNYNKKLNKRLIGLFFYNLITKKKPAPFGTGQNIIVAIRLFSSERLNDRSV
ncbi:hypothetical protein D3C72_918240 [compost metagenome]